MSGEHGELFRTWRDTLQRNDGYIVGEFCDDAAKVRALACLNALDGVTTEAIEAGAVRELVKAARRYESNGLLMPSLSKALKPFEEITCD